MKIINKLILVLIITLLTFSAKAACKFELKFGDDASKVIDKYGPPSRLLFDDVSFIPVAADDVCPSQRLKDVAIEYRFLNNKLSAINLVALNDENNSVSDKLTLMKYAKRVYGNFDTGPNPKLFIGYEIFEKQNYFVVYQKVKADDHTFDEQIYISTKEQDKLLIEYYTKMEEQQAQDMDNNQ